MIPHKSYPIPYEKIWVSAYADAKTECFEIRTIDKNQAVPFYDCWHKEYPLGTAISDFVYLDLSFLSKHFREISAHIEAINNNREVVPHFQALFDYTSFWLKESPLLAPLSATLERMHLIHEQGQRLTMEPLERQAEYYRTIQPWLRQLSADFFETDANQDMQQRYMSAQFKDAATYPMLRFQTVSLEEVHKGGPQRCLYDNLEELMFAPEQKPAPQTFFITEVINCLEPEDLVHFLLTRYLQENLRFRTCKFCGKYFGFTGNSKVEYCERPIDGSDKTCRTAGAFRLYEKRKLEDPAVREYKRSYKAHNARIRYGIMTKEEFSQWSKEAREKRDLCVAGKLSLEEFVAWLDQDKIN